MIDLWCFNILKTIDSLCNCCERAAAYDLRALIVVMKQHDQLEDELHVLLHLFSYSYTKKSRERFPIH